MFSVIRSIQRWLLFAALVVAATPLIGEVLKLDLSNLNVAASSISTRALSTSAIVALFSSVIAALISILPGILLARQRRAWLLWLLAIPIILPPLVLAYGAASLLRVFELRGGIAMIILAHVFLAFPVCVFILRFAFLKVDPDISDAAKNLGLTEFQTWRLVEWPQLKSWFALALVISSLVSWGDFYFSWYLGGLQQTVATEVYSSLGSQIRPETVLLGILSALIAAIFSVIAFRIMQTGEGRR